MSDMNETEKQQAAAEARSAVAYRPAGSSSADRAAALRRYLGAEQYHELRQESGAEGTDEPER